MYFRSYDHDKEDILDLEDIYNKEYCIEGMKLTNPEFADNDLPLAYFCFISDSNFDSCYINYYLKTWREDFDMLTQSKFEGCYFYLMDHREKEFTSIIDKITDDKYKKPLFDFLKRSANINKVEFYRMTYHRSSENKSSGFFSFSEEKWDDFKSSVKTGVGDFLDPHSMTIEIKTTTYFGVFSVEETREFHRGDRDAVGFKDKNMDYYYKTVNAKK